MTFYTIFLSLIICQMVALMKQTYSNFITFTSNEVVSCRTDYKRIRGVVIVTTLEICLQLHKLCCKLTDLQRRFAKETTKLMTSCISEAKKTDVELISVRSLWPSSRTKLMGNLCVCYSLSLIPVSLLISEKKMSLFIQ